MRLGYNTNGFAHHRLADALCILAETGYSCVAVTLERDLLDPPDRRGVTRAVDLLAPLLEATALAATIETGARFILDARRKHQPTLVSTAEPERHRRIEFLKAAVDVAAGINADTVSVWSGSADHATDNHRIFDDLVAALSDVLNYAQSRAVRVAFEPEPGMFIATMAQFERLHRHLNHASLGLTLDVGHICCLADGDGPTHIRRWRRRLWNVHLEDMRKGRHEHLMFGDGDVDFDEVFEALHEIGYDGPVHVELSRHSNDAVAAARQAYAFLRPFFVPTQGGGSAPESLDPNPRGQ